MKTTLITTIFNEEKNVGKFIDSILEQTELPDEVVIVDGGSKDKTLEIINKKTKNALSKTKFYILIKKGNRSVGRNEAIKKASGDLILSTDAGCILDKNWVRNIIAPFRNKDVDVVAGYYKGIPRNVFQKCLIPYVLIMPDKINEENFLPATRSMAFKKSVWKKAGRFNEKFSHNEDFAFANKLKEINAKIVFAEGAVVNWIPRKNIKEAFIMFFRFALGDAQAIIFRDKVIYIFLRYLLAIYLLFIGIVFRSVFFWSFYIVLILIYIGWSIFKNYRYVGKYMGFVYLPLLQVNSDLAVMLGTIVGIVQKVSIKGVIETIYKNRGLSFILIVYIISILSVIEWGIPNFSHPFNYHMDEWHFSQALRAFLKYGTGSVSGAASIPLFHIVSSIIFIIPFYLLRIVNPFAIKSSVTNLQMQHIFFVILRLHTLFYGVLSLSLIYITIKKYIKLFPVAFTAIFAFTPLWIFLNNFYKYDITLIFWILATIFFIFKFNDTQKISNYFFAGIACGLALSTKFTAAPLFLTYLLSYFIFSKNIKIKHIFVGFFLTMTVFCLVGIPDLIFGKGNYYQLLNSTLVQAPQANSNYNLGLPNWIFLTVKEFPFIFGYLLVLLSYLSFLYWSFVLVNATLKKRLEIYRGQIFIYLTYVILFILSLSFGIEGGGNRALVMLPFMVLLSAFFIKDIKGKHKILLSNKVLLTILVLVLFFQLIQSLAWNSVKLSEDPRVTSSEWIQKNIPGKNTIGIENIPIYQNLPDFILKEFYLKQYDKKYNTKYNYLVISSATKSFPKFVIITQDYNNVNYLKNSPKKDLVTKLSKEGYRKIIVFSPNLRYYDLFSDRITFIIIYPTPITISIYEK
jgi:glycosyltransferase involved in cell wall biosynthesis